jgi:inner membrane protein
LDSLTHIALGACMGEAFAGQKLGKKAMLWGALAQSIPDIDFIAGLWQRTAENLLTHRGFTHSILFSIVVAFILALLAEKWHRPHNISFTRWVSFFGSVILAHILLDACNNYGVGWFEPFSHYRISFNLIYVVDPFFSFVPGIALVMLLLLKKFSRKRRFWWKAGLGIGLLYLSYCVINKVFIDHEIKQLLSKQHIKYDRYFTTAAPLQNWLWFVVAGSDSGYYVGYRSVFDKAERIEMQYFPANRSFLDHAPDQKEVEQLVRFSQGYFTAVQKNDTLIFNDLRFGQVVGWANPNEAFAFHYYLQPAVDNRLVVQRGRFAKWNWKALSLFCKRISGNSKTN